MERKTKKARRGRGEGGISFREDKNLWYARLSLGYDGQGRRIRKTVYGETKAEVAEELRKLQAEHDAGRLVDSEGITTGEYLTRWLNNTAKNRVRAATRRRYKQLVELYLVPILGGVKLSKLTPLHVEQCYASMERGDDKRKPAGATTRRAAGTILSIALRHAVRVKLLPHNPAADVAKARPTEREMRVMTEQQARRFLEAAKPHRHYALFALALGAGMRQGELLALQWGDIDFEKGSVEVKRSLSQVGNEFIVKEPKSKAGKRTILLPPFVLTALRDHRTAALKAGQITAPVFCTRTGTFTSKNNIVRQVFRPLIKKANAAAVKAAGKTISEPGPIPADIRFHDLRHTHASHLIAAGHSIKAVSRRLGHADITITLKVYAHLMPNDDEKLAAGVETLYG
jgi:integrase